MLQLVYWYQVNEDSGTIGTRLGGNKGIIGQGTRGVNGGGGGVRQHIGKRRCWVAAVYSRLCLLVLSLFMRKARWPNPLRPYDQEGAGVHDQNKNAVKVCSLVGHGNT